MVKRKSIEALCRRIGEEFHPEKIILFGSYAYGNPTPDSDVDLLVIMPFEGHPAEKATEIRLKVGPRFPLDLIVRTPEKVQERLKLGDDFIEDVMEMGRVLYESSSDLSPFPPGRASSAGVGSRMR